MNPLGIIALIGAGVLLWPKLAGAVSLSNIAKQIQIATGGISLKMSEVGLFSTTLYPQIIATNPTTSSTTIDSITGSLLLNGQKIGSYYLANIPIVPGINEITLPVVLSNASSLSSIVAFLLGDKKGGLQFRTEGVLNVGSVTAPFAENYSVDPKVLTKQVITDTKKDDAGKPTDSTGKPIDAATFADINKDLLAQFNIKKENLNFI